MSRVAITGASGFIGGRIVELLNAQPGHEMRLLVRRFGGLARAVRSPVEVIRPRAWDVAGVAEVLEGCDTVLHCAHDWNDAGWNVAFAKTLVRASAQAGVDAIVALSSASVYYPSAEPTIVERAHATSTPWEYAQVKRDVTEALLSESRAHAVPAAVLEPPCVYGPFSGFANVPAQQLRAGRVVVPTDDEGVAHLVHVDDVVHAMLAAAESSASGRFLVTGAQPVTWSWFYGAIQREIGAGEVVPMSAAAVDELLAPTAGAAVRRARTDPRVVLSSPGSRSLATPCTASSATRAGARRERRFRDWCSPSHRTGCTDGRRPRSTTAAPAASSDMRPRRTSRGAWRSSASTCAGRGCRAGRPATLLGDVPVHPTLA